MLQSLYKQKKFLICLIIIALTFYLCSYLLSQFSTQQYESNDLFEEQELAKMPNHNAGPECILPLLIEPTHEKILNKYRISCKKNPENLVTIKNGKFVLKEGVKMKCSYRRIIGVGNNNMRVASETVNFQSGDSIPNDYFTTTCLTENNSKYTLPILGIKPLTNVAKERSQIRPSPRAMNYNIVFLGFDAMSRISVMENMPEVYKHFTQTMKGIVLKKHSVVGDGSTLNILAMTTGLSLSQLLKGRNRHSTPVDSFPLIFHDLKKSGYITLHSEDYPQGGSFQLSVGGFRKVPLDHYTRPFFLHEPIKSGCLGNVNRHNVFFNMLREFFSVYDSEVNKFAFIHQVDSSHDNNTWIQNVEDDLLELLKEFRPDGMFNRTILVLYSDHGARYEAKRATLQGKYEERLPILGIYLPPKLRQDRPDIVKNLEKNTKRLTTQFDVHATLLHILDKQSASTAPVNQSISLFNKIPHRSCKTVGLTAHWCWCGKITKLSNDSKVAVSAAQATINKINNLTRELREICSEVKLEVVQLAEVREATNEFLAFKKVIAHKNYQYDMSDEKNATEIIYQMTFRATPGDGVFESSVHWNVQSHQFTVLEEEISRINRYAPWVKCLQEKYPTKRKFCICKDAI